MTMKQETYAKARSRLMSELAARGWDVRTHPGEAWSQQTSNLKPLKVPWAQMRGIRLWFKPQAVHVSYGVGPKLSNARSLPFDIRGASCTDLISMAERMG